MRKLKKILILTLFFLLSVGYYSYAITTPTVDPDQTVEINNSSNPVKIAFPNNVTSFTWSCSVFGTLGNNIIEFHLHETSNILTVSQGQGQEGVVLPISHDPTAYFDFFAPEIGDNTRVIIKVWYNTASSGGNIDLSETNGWLKKIFDLLNDDSAFNDSISHLERSVDNMTNYGPLGVAKSVAGTVGNMGVRSGENLPKIEVQFFPDSPPINVFDLSAWQRQIWEIRVLMTAMLWLGLAFYLLQYIIPHFKV